MHEAKKPEVIFKDQVAKPRDGFEDVARGARRVYIKAKDIEQYGYTSGCPKCEHEMKYGKGRTTVPHSERCRQHIMAELAKTEAGQRRIEDATVRLDRALGEMGEQIPRKEPPAAQGEVVVGDSSVSE